MGKDKGDHSKRGKYATYTAVERARIGRYAAENGTTRASKHFSQLWKKDIPEAYHVLVIFDGFKGQNTRVS